MQCGQVKIGDIARGSFFKKRWRSASAASAEAKRLIPSNTVAYLNPVIGRTTSTNRYRRNLTAPSVVSFLPQPQASYTHRIQMERTRAANHPPFVLQVLGWNLRTDPSDFDRDRGCFDFRWSRFVTTASSSLLREWSLGWFRRL